MTKFLTHAANSYFLSSRPWRTVFLSHCVLNGVLGLYMRKKTLVGVLLLPNSPRWRSELLSPPWSRFVSCRSISQALFCLSFGKRTFTSHLLPLRTPSKDIKTILSNRAVITFLIFSRVSIFTHIWLETLVLLCRVNPCLLINRIQICAWPYRTVALTSLQRDR